MKNIQIYHADKYSTPAYIKVEENIYKGKNPYRVGGEDKTCILHRSPSSRSRSLEREKHPQTSRRSR